jgi:hypothetical protein
VFFYALAAEELNWRCGNTQPEIQPDTTKRQVRDKANLTEDMG